MSLQEVKLLIGCGGFAAYQFLTNSECLKTVTRREAAGANIRCREGNNPDLRLRSRNLR